MAEAGRATSSTFTANDEGWRVGDYLVPSVPSVPTYLAAGGNPGGFIRTDDRSAWTAFLAPAAYLGNQSAFLGGTLRFDIRILASDPTVYPPVLLEGAGLQIARIGVANPVNNIWNTFQIALVETGWYHTTTLNPVTAAEFASVMGNLTALRISADWLTGPDQVDLDNVGFVSTVPEPATISLFGAAITALAFARRRRG